MSRTNQTLYRQEKVALVKSRVRKQSKTRKRTHLKKYKTR